MTRRPNGPYLIESSPQYGKRRAFLFLQRMSMLPIHIFCAAVSGYQSELHHMRNAAPDVDQIS